jgi:hypothetical protein
MPNGISQQERERRERYKRQCQELLTEMNRILNTANRAVDDDDYKKLNENLRLLPRKKFDLLLRISMLWNQPFLRWYHDLKNLDTFIDSAVDRIRRFLTERDDPDDKMTDKQKWLMKDVIRIIRQYKEEFEKEEMDPYDILY